MSEKDNSGFKLMLGIALFIFALVLVLFLVNKILLPCMREAKEKRVNEKADQQVMEQEVKKVQEIQESHKEILRKREEKEKILKERVEKIKVEIDKCPEDSKNFIKDKLSALYRKFDDAKKHLDEIREKEGEKTIDESLKLLNRGHLTGFVDNQDNLFTYQDEIDGKLLHNQVISNKEPLEQYEALLIAREIHKNEKRNMDFRFVNRDNHRQEIKIENAIKNIEESYDIFFTNAARLKNKNDLESFWNYSSYDGLFNVFAYIFKNNGIDGQKNENFNLKNCLGVPGHLAAAYNERTPNQEINHTDSTIHNESLELKPD